MEKQNYETLRIQIPKKVCAIWKNQASEHSQSLEEYLQKILLSRMGDTRLARLPVNKILKLTTPQEEANRVDFYS
ncbi:hypothetical protein Rhal01_00354 [Rubritalea halochordaticola]|uniref:Uncharacterized protein n=1 Tax=Rubritalea halochordaticola TaxID=714537 RepID=A0ABP9UZC9_9BACT